MEPNHPNNSGGALRGAFDGSNGDLDPTLNPTTGRPQTRAIKDELQAADTVRAVTVGNAERNRKNARISAKLNAEQPYDTAELKKEGLLWKSNFSTQPLGVLLERASPRFPAAVESAKYLTSTKLRSDIDDWELKSERFQQAFTTLCRSYVSWVDLVEQLAFENTTFGFGAAVYTDNLSLFPKSFRQDEFYVPPKTTHNSSECQILVARETYAPHKLFEKIADPAAAAVAGWNVKAVVNLINDAMPETFRSSTTSDDLRRWEDLARSSNLYTSLANGAKEVVLYHLFATEVTGKVSQIICSGDAYKEVFRSYDRFESMDRVASFFSYQQANGELQGSKGIGRLVYNLAVVLDRARNEVFDRLNLSGKIILQGDAKAIRTFRMSVIGNTVVIDKAFQISPGKMDANVEDFERLESWASRTLDAIAGNVSAESVASQFKGERVTDSQVNLVAGLQSETKDVKVARFMRQFANLAYNIQLRLIDPLVKHPLKDAFMASCLEVMSQEEVEALAKQPVVETVSDFTESERQNLVAACEQAKGDPFFNQLKLREISWTSRFGDEVAKSVLLPANDPTEQAEQIRLQLMESALLDQGKQVPVSPRDSDQIHLELLMQDMQGLSQSAETNAVALQQLAGRAMHAHEHIQSAQSKGMPAAQLKKYVDALAGVTKGLQEMQARQQAQQQAQQIAVNGGVPPAPMPMTATSPNPPVQ